MTTLLLLLLLAGLAVATQGRALAQARLLARIETGHRNLVALHSVHALVRPLVAEGMTSSGSDTPPPLVMDGSVNDITAEGRLWNVQVRMGSRGRTVGVLISRQEAEGP